LIFYDCINEEIAKKKSLGTWAHGSIFSIQYESLPSRAYVMDSDISERDILKTVDALHIMKTK
jgi:hypothetical protein